MKPAAPAFILLLGLAACQGPTPESPQQTVAASVPPVASGGTPLPEALPHGFTLNFPYHFIKREMAYAGKAGDRLRYTVEYLEGDAGSIADRLGESAKAAGFRNGEAQVFGDGRIHFIASRPGYGQLRAEIRPAGRRKLSHPDAAGTLVMGWPAPAGGAALPTPR